MTDYIAKQVFLSTEDAERLFSVSKALASEIRIEILKLLNTDSLNVNEIAEKLGIPTSTAAVNVKFLEDAGLILTELQPGVRGSMKLCSRKIDLINIELSPQTNGAVVNSFYINMPIGSYIDCKVSPTCGIMSEKACIDVEDNPRSFYNPERINAQLIWFYKGYVEYRFPNSILQHGKANLLELSLELCSEAPNYRNNWPSDITLWINDFEIGTWTCPGDFGGRRGRLNPQWWPDASTQYGMLKTWRINSEGSSIDEMPLSGIRLEDLSLNSRDYISVRIGVKEDAANVGGINIFGDKFGDHAQNIVMRIDYSNNFE
ncbi:ArsR/SmtB family transcription factor [Ruminiclostridium cellobioparum]|jgi:predicted transcriptional regulator|uniref:ArsR/SmtB family transcription factor n=1 Tax=Ruminiclostridium cellobioparum TaxID=29355 RepID=UPI00054E2203|nr:ArsR family transcriptional regulator [Ruminiclostridium cellobioparum]